MRLFSYFGSKYRIAPFYAPPMGRYIIEPFAGSAGYSLRYFNKQVRLYDTNVEICGVWDYLIKSSSAEIRKLPIAERTDELKVCQEAKWLIGFWLTESQTIASRYPLSRSRGSQWTARRRDSIAKFIDNIRHWKVKQLSWEKCPIRTNVTWFIDPPYSQAGHRYRCNNIDYNKLAAFCLFKWPGQLIACEQHGATWLPFRTLLEQSNGSNQIYREVVWNRL